MTLYHYYVKKYDSSNCTTTHISGVVHVEDPVKDSTEYLDLVELVHQAVGDSDVVIASLSRL